MKIKVNTYSLKNKKLKKDLNILIISDIHNNIKALNTITKYLNTIKIDYILIPGDVIDINDLDNEKEFLKKIIDLGEFSKVFICLGNHDKYVKYDKEYMLDKDLFDTNFYKTLTNKKNISLMCDRFNSIKLDNITISCLNLDNKYYKDHESNNSFKEYICDIDNNYSLNNSNFNVLLVHSPNCLIENKKIINYSKIINKNNLIVCGHNHGGLVHPFLQDLFKNHTGLFGPFHKFIQKNSYGVWNNDDKSLLDSNGVTKISSTSSFKLFHPLINKILMPEIDLIYLEKSDNNENLKLLKRKKYKG